MSADDRPNILLLMTDQQRFDSLGSYGCAAAHTPNLDRLAADGVLFENCYVNNPICTPSRASLLTGQHLPGHGVYRLNDVLPPDQVLISKRLQGVGYTTALIGKLHVSGAQYEAEHRHPNDGFDVYEWCLEASLMMDSPFHGYGRWLREQDAEFFERLRRERRAVLHIPRRYHMTHWAAEQTINFIQHADSRQPFFCIMSIFDPHNPYEDYPLEMADLIDEQKIADPVFAEGEIATKPRAMQREHVEGVLGPWPSFSRADLRKMRLGYHASLALADLEIGRVLEALEQKGIARNTLVIFVSDHGDMLGDHQLLVKGAYFYDACVKVPLIMRWPAHLAGGRRTAALVQPHDLAATILSAAGVDAGALAAVMPASVSLLELAAGQTNAVHDLAVCCYRNSGKPKGREYFDPPIYATMVRDARYKLSVYHDVPGAGAGCEGTLYDMQQDPGEQCDLWSAPHGQDVKSRLLQRALDWLVGQELQFGSRGGVAPKRRLT
jgi:arylsulfatase A-like enzyme